MMMFRAALVFVATPIPAIAALGVAFVLHLPVVVVRVCGPRRQRACSGGKCQGDGYPTETSAGSRQRQF
jgi:hypothetical protein